MKFDELVISFERLIRFEYPLQKRNRVYKEIIFKHLISPKISLKNFYSFSSVTINALVQQIWNYSLEKLDAEKRYSTAINAFMAFEEIKTFSCELLVRDLIFPFVNDPENFLKTPYMAAKVLNEAGFAIKTTDSFYSVYHEYFMTHPLNFEGLFKLIDNNSEISKNFKRLRELNSFIKKQNGNITEYSDEFLEEIYKESCLIRLQKGYRFPINLILIVEGITEEKLLPLFAKQAGIDFDKNGIFLIAAGGKNQSAKLYKKFSQEVSLPILILFDSDADHVIEELNDYLRPTDKIFKIPDGEFEDILSVDLICKALNSFYRLTAEVSPFDFAGNNSRVTLLENLWKEKGFGEFHKAEFAKIIAENISSERDLSEELKKLFNAISAVI